MKPKIILSGSKVNRSGELNGDTLSIRITDKGLQPEYSPGSIVFIKKVIGWQRFFDYGHTCVVFLTDGRMLFKKIKKSKLDPERNVLCVSTYPELIEEELPKHLIQDVYKVVGSFTFH